MLKVMLAVSSLIAVATMDGSSNRKSVVNVKVVKKNCDPLTAAATMDGSSSRKNVANDKGVKKHCKWVIQIRFTKRLTMHPFKSSKGIVVPNVVL